MEMVDMVVVQPPGPPGLDPQAGGNAWAAFRVLTDSLATQKNHTAWDVCPDSPRFPKWAMMMGEIAMTPCD
jgi:hypothetical protein